MGNPLVDLLLPPACVACRAAGRWPLCGECRREMPFLREPLCPRCGLPVPCGRSCPAAALAFDASWAPLAHAGPARSLVHALKFQGGRALGDALAAPIAAGMPRPEGVLVPVPCASSRRRRRGYDQATSLARALAERTGAPVAAVLGRADQRQHSRLSRADRLASGQARSIGIVGAAPASCVLVDDVHTTGATLHACALALREAGAERVVAVTATRALDSR